MIHILHGTFDLLGQVNAKPDPNGLPGSSAASKLINGIFYFVLLACLAGFLVSAGTWAIASRVQNHHQTQNGKMGVMISAGAGFLAGAGPAIVNFFINAGKGI